METKDDFKSKLLFGEQFVVRTTEMAEVFGTTGAEVVQYVHFRVLGGKWGVVDDLGRRWIYLSHAQLMELTGVALRTIQRCLADLRKIGILIDRPGDEASKGMRYYRIDHDVAARLKARGPNTPTAGGINPPLTVKTT